MPQPPLPKPRPREDATARRSAAPESPMPRSERQCRAALADAGASFAEAPAVHEPEDGCRMDHPVLLGDLGDGVALEPPALLSCPMAEATVRFMHEEVTPAAERHLETVPEALFQVSAYVCRSRHGSETMSEHATGNALDWGAIGFEDGTVLDIRDYGADEAAERDFFEEIREAACGPFTTVLGPGTDAAHADHFHFDLAERSGGAFCR